MEDSTFLYELVINPTDGALFITMGHLVTVASLAVGAWEVFDLKERVLEPAVKAVSGSSNQNRNQLPAPRGGM